MLKFVLQKMLNKRWLMLALLIGNILLMSITSSNAMYIQSAQQRNLQQRLTDSLYQKNLHPGQITIQTNNSPIRNQLTRDAAKQIYDIADRFGLPCLQVVEHYTLDSQKLVPDQMRGDGMRQSAILCSRKDLEQHVQIVGGQMFSSTPNDDGSIDVMLSVDAFSYLNVTLNETFIASRLKDAQGNPLKLRVSGVFQYPEGDSLYWRPATTEDQRYTQRQECFLPYEIFQPLFIEENNTTKLNGKFYAVLDYSQMDSTRAQEYVDIATAYNEEYTATVGIVYYDSFRLILKDFIQSQRQITITLWVLQVPIYVLLAAFIYMVSRQILDMEQTEIAVLKSRGVSRRQLISVYLIQSAILALIGVVAGLPLGAYLVQVIGSANAFLEFVGRSPLSVYMSSTVVTLLAASVVLSIAVMVLPALRHSKVTIVGHMQKKHRKNQAPIWQKIFLDVALLAVSLYGLFNYNNQKTLLFTAVASEGTLDPLLFICSSLFMVGAALFALRLLPMITYVIFLAFRKLWNPALYAAFLRVVRSRFSQYFIMFFLILTIALGVFNAQTARTINASEEDNIRYATGADIVFMEHWKTKPISETEVVYIEPLAGRYEAIEGVQQLTKVLDTSGNIIANGQRVDAKIMGIHSKTFGETAWMKDGVLNHHFYEYLNALAKDPHAILLSRDFQTKYGLALGDSVPVRNLNNQLVSCTVYGFIDYWPTFAPFTYQENEDGSFHKVEASLVVANLDLLQAEWGVEPYWLWIRTEDSTQPIYDYIAENKIAIATTGDGQQQLYDTSDQIVRMKNDPFFQGTNGILTVGFVVSLLLCAVGFLIYWILSIRSRSLQFGIYRAMGMSMGEVLTMLICEQVFITGTSVGAGLLVGALTSKFFIPLIQIAYNAQNGVLPLEVISNSNDTARLLIMVGSMILVCMVILGWLISRMKIDQALKLGED